MTTTSRWFHRLCMSHEWRQWGDQGSPRQLCPHNLLDSRLIEAFVNVHVEGCVVTGDMRTAHWAHHCVIAMELLHAEMEK